MIDKTKQQASKFLGQEVEYKDQYDKSLLVPVERVHNREKYGIIEGDLPFVGYDTWNAYEVSYQLKNGLPVSAIAKISYPCDTKSIVESKSLKLYLNSYNMTRFDMTREESLRFVEEQIAEDLTEVLGGQVECKLHTVAEDVHAFDESEFIDIESLVQGEEIVFDQYNESADILKLQKDCTVREVKIKTSLLRSNCRITNQPDWGDAFIVIESSKIPTMESLLQYIVSFRKESHFHEECAEMIYKRLWDLCEPEALMVTCLYTRRGGLDINPARASHQYLLSQTLGDVEVHSAKTLRQ